LSKLKAAEKFSGSATLPDIVPASRGGGVETAVRIYLSLFSAGDDEAALSMLVNMLTEEELAALTEVNF
jgi:hypothetical protein